VNPVILVPIKEPKNAKSRLAGVLTPAERSRLAETMLEDVASALCDFGACVVAVTSSPEAARRSRAFGWRVMCETLQISESASVDWASAQLSKEGVASVLRLPADIPLVTPADVEQILKNCPPAPFAALVPSDDLMGTNALLRKPPDLFPSRFGPNSYVLHIQEAQRARAQIRISALSNIALDIDDISDLGRFMERPTDTHTHLFLQKIAIRERLGQREFG
jgi:2-phospho-L-lactate guanylyltransferase